MTITGPSKEEIAAVRHALRDIVAAARELDAEPVVVFIPSRASATGPLTAEAGAYDGLLAAMKEMGVATIDLRPIFREHSKPASLYYEEDAHWNADGMALASDRILALFPTGT